MEIKYSYYKWFQKVMSVFIDVFFVAAPLASLYVFTSFLSGTLKYVAYAALIVVYLAVIYFGRGMIGEFLDRLLQKLENVDAKTMFLAFTILFLALKIVFTLFFNYDGTKSGDIKIYNDIAEQILETGDIHSRAISHLYGLALHFVLIRLLGLPLHAGLAFAVYIGIVCNFFSFRKICGKEKAFLVTVLYILMPSTIFFTFSPTHEVFVFMYVSLFLYFFNRCLKEEKKTMLGIDFLVMVLTTVLTCFVNPGGYIIYIIILLCVFLSNVKIGRKGLIVLALLCSIFLSSSISKYLNVNEYKTTMNTYTILIHGVNPNTLGEQEDGYPLKQIRMYLHENTLDFSKAGFVDAAKHVLIDHYIYLLKNPVTLLRLIVHKTYILWSGVHYPIELAHFYEAVSGIPYYLFLAVNTLIYLFVLTLFHVYRQKQDDEIAYSNFKLELLGVIALTLFCIVVNKYSVYVTMFIYLIAFKDARFRR